MAEVPHPAYAEMSRAPWPPHGIEGAVKILTFAGAALGFLKGTVS